jgi:ATP-binding cassette, subfamily B, bacterial
MNSRWSPVSESTAKVTPTTPGGAIETLGRGVRSTPELTRGIGLTIGLAMAGAVGRVAVPILIQQAIDRGISADGVKLDVVMILSAIGVAVIVATGIAQRAAAVRLGVRAEEALYALRVRLFQHIHRLSLADHAEERRGTLVARVTSDMETLTQFFSWGGVSLLLNVTLMVLVAGVMIAYDWVLALVAFAVAAPLALVLRAVQRRLVRAYDLSRTKNAEMLTAVSELVMGNAVSRSAGSGPEIVRRVGVATKERTDSLIKAQTYGALLFPSGELFSVFTVAAVIGIGVARGPASGLTSGALIGFVFLTYRFLEPIAEFTEILDQTQAAVAGFRRILGVLDLPIGPPQPEHPIELPDGPLDVVIDKVTFAYPPRLGDDEAAEPAIRGVSAGIRPGEQVAVVGATGSGKSTLALLVVRLTDPTAGMVRLGGVDLRRVTNDDLRARVMMVPQDPFLFDASVESNLVFAAPGASHRDIERAFAELDLADWLESLPDGLATRVGERGDQLSAGERQLVALVRAFLADPDVLVLDEATSSVDPVTETRLGRALEHLAEGRTTIAIAHRLSTAARADRVLVMEHGVLVEQGSHSELVAAGGAYAALYASWIDATSMF